GAGRGGGGGEGGGGEGGAGEGGGARQRHVAAGRGDAQRVGADRRDRARGRARAGDHLYFAGHHHRAADQELGQADGVLVATVVERAHQARALGGRPFEVDDRHARGALVPAEPGARGAVLRARLHGPAGEQVAQPAEALLAPLEAARRERERRAVALYRERLLHHDAP